MQNVIVASEQRGFNLGDAFRQAREKSRVDGLIGDAVRAGAKGKTKAESREFLIEQLHAHGREVPAQPVLDLHLDVILASGTPLGRAQVTVQALKSLGQSIERVFHVKDYTRGDPRRFLFIPGDRKRSAEVSLDDEAQSWMEGVAPNFSWTLRGLTSQMVDVRQGESGEIEVLLEGRRAGRLLGADAEEVLSALALAPDLDTAGMSSSRMRGDDGLWHLYVNLPDEDFVRRVRDAVGEADS